MPIDRRTKVIGLFSVMLLMAITRYHHFGSALHLPDASLAIFFIAGFLVSSISIFALLLVEAGMIDYLAITIGGTSDWCVSPAYGFLIPSYAMLWLAGRWYASKHRVHFSSLLPLFASLGISTSIAFFISNGSFYALSGRFQDLSWMQYSERVAKYYLPYMSSAFLYVVMAALVVVLAMIVSNYHSVRITKNIL